MPLRCTWRNASPSFSHNTRTRNLRKTRRSPASRQKETRSRRGRLERTRRSNRLWRWSRWTQKSARSGKRSKIKRMPVRNRRSRRRCRWRTQLDISKDAGFGSKQRENSSPKKAKRDARARKRRRSDIFHSSAVRKFHNSSSLIN